MVCFRVKKYIGVLEWIGVYVWLLYQAIGELKFDKITTRRKCMPAIYGTIPGLFNHNESALNFSVNPFP